MNARVQTPRERPILMSGSLVVATLERRKTQTRRVAKLNAAGRIQERGGKRRQWHPDDPAAVAGCPYGAPGDRLWVRETFALECCAEIGWYEPPHDDGRPLKITDDGDGRYWTQPHYRATDPAPELVVTDADGIEEPGVRWTPSIHMPRWASRLLLVVRAVRLERLHAIGEDDAGAEGCCSATYRDGRGHEPATVEFRRLWQTINAHRPGCAWNDNPRVWVVSFEVVDAKGWRAA
jgi:hypothetical protein